MATLGDILAAARRDTGAFAARILVVDPALAGDLAGASHGMNTSIAGFVRLAVADFARLASDEDWTTLISAMRDSADPGMTCLAGMVQWRIDAPCCASQRVASAQGAS